MRNTDKNNGFVARGGGYPDEKERETSRGCGPGQTGLRVEGVLAFRRLLSGGTGVSRPENRCFLSSVPLENCAGGTIFALLREAAGKQELLTTLQRSARGRNPWRSPAPFLAVPEGTGVLARGGTPDGLRR